MLTLIFCYKRKIFRKFVTTSINVEIRAKMIYNDASTNYDSLSLNGLNHGRIWKIIG